MMRALSDTVVSKSDGLIQCEKDRKMSAIPGPVIGQETLVICLLWLANAAERIIVLGRHVPQMSQIYNSL